LIALYVGGMGAKGTNFHLDVFARMGWEKACAVVQEHYLAGRKNEAAAAIPTAMIDDIALVGPPARIREQITRWENTVVTTLLVQSTPFGGDDLSGLSAIAQAIL
jgi:alkanesulfonate monooxygenase SsuD/methylene tetrahydromethanopterin reductase-like flavin-dependent oxidoreductase (luciferase family)